MMKWVYSLATGELLNGGPFDPPHDPATQGIETYVENPDPRTERWDGTAATKKRAATAQEVTAYDTAQATQIAQSRFDGEKLVKALAIWTAQKLNVPLATAKQEILTIYKGLP